MTSHITTVADVETSQSVSEVCEEDHPLFSQAASLKSEVLSMGDARRVEIEAWLADGILVYTEHLRNLAQKKSILQHY